MAWAYIDSLIANSAAAIMIVLVVIVIGLVGALERLSWIDGTTMSGPQTAKGGSSESLGTLTLHENYQRITRRRRTKTEKHRRDYRDVPPHSEFRLCGKNVRAECNGKR